MKDPWQPGQYERFKAERAAPFLDLLALVRPAPGMRVVDLGCGTGELTRRLHDHVGARETLGIDRSAAMLERSAAFVVPGLRFEAGDIAAFPPAGTEGTWDLVSSNAALQWLPDHEALFARLAAALAPGGQLAVQVPAMHAHATQAAAREVAREAPFAAALGEAPVVLPRVLAPEAYAALLARLGFGERQVGLRIYEHHLAGREDVVEWVKGTLLAPYRERLPPPLYAEFLARYAARLLPRLEDARPYLFPFERILLWARR